MKSFFKFFNSSVLLYGLATAIILDSTLSLKFTSFVILATVFILLFGVILIKKVQQSNTTKLVFLILTFIIVTYKAAIFGLNVKSESLTELWVVEELVIDGKQINYEDSIILKVKLNHNVFNTKNEANVMNLKYRYKFGDKLKIDGSSCSRNGGDYMPWLDYNKLRGINFVGTYEYENIEDQLIVTNNLNRVVLKKIK